MPTYAHICEICNHEWEEIYGMSSPIPNVCPSCKAEGNVKRLISLGAGIKVELQGRELIEKLRADGKAMAKEARTNEKLANTLYGPGAIY